MRVQLGRAVALTLILALSGCDDDSSFTPTVDNVAGAYSATTFTLTVAVVFPCQATLLLIAVVLTVSWAESSEKSCGVTLSGVTVADLVAVT